MGKQAIGPTGINWLWWDLRPDANLRQRPGGFINFFFICHQLHIFLSFQILTDSGLTDHTRYDRCWHILYKWWSQWMMSISGLCRQAKLELHYLKNRNESKVWNLTYLESCGRKGLIVQPISATISLRMKFIFFTWIFHSGSIQPFQSPLNRVSRFFRT